MIGSTESETPKEQPGAADKAITNGNGSKEEDSAQKKEARESSRSSQTAQSGPSSYDSQKFSSLEVSVDHNIERAMKVLKRKLIKEGLFKELKSRRYYEKPSEKRKRKQKETLKKIRKDEARRKKNMAQYNNY